MFAGVEVERKPGKKHLVKGVYEFVGGIEKHSDVIYSFDVISFKFLLHQDWAVARSVVDSITGSFCTLLYYSVLLRHEGRFYAGLSYS